MSTLVLIADSDPFNLRLLQELCEAAGYRVATASDGGEVLDTIARERPGLLLLDVAMPTLDGFEVMRILKSDRELASIPVILVTPEGDVDARGRGIELGAEDYLTKPYRVFDVQQRVRNALRLQAAESDAAKALRRARNSEAVDSLTRAGTAQQLRITLNYEFTRASRYGHSLACVVIQLGNFEQIVEVSGQDGGEGALVQVAAGLRTCVRAIDYLFRSDVDEFVLLLPETGQPGVDAVLHRIHSRAEDQSLWGVSMSPTPLVRAAAATFPEHEVPGGDELLQVARAKLRPA